MTPFLAFLTAHWFAVLLLLLALVPGRVRPAQPAPRHAVAGYAPHGRLGWRWRGRVGWRWSPNGASGLSSRRRPAVLRDVPGADPHQRPGSTARLRRRRRLRHWPWRVDRRAGGRGTGRLPGGAGQPGAGPALVAVASGSSCRSSSGSATAAWRGLGPVRRWVALGLRCLLITLVALALAELRIKHQNDTVTVLFLSTAR